MPVGPKHALVDRVSIKGVSVSTCASICKKEAIVTAFRYLNMEKLCLIPDNSRIDLKNTSYNSTDNEMVYVMNDRFDKGTKWKHNLTCMYIVCRLRERQNNISNRFET